jgi:endonuclease YncB( thermonuclease family)
MQQDLAQNNYKNLLNKIQEYLLETQQDIMRKKVELAWQVGKLVDEYLSENSSSGYGEQLFQRLEMDIQIGKDSLYKMRNFYQSYPTLPRDNPKLNWSHYSILSGVKDENERKYLEDLVKKNSWSVASLKEQALVSKKETSKVTTNKSAKITKLPFSRGRLFTYKITELIDEKFLDLGFNNFQKMGEEFKAGDVVESKKKTPTPLDMGAKTEFELEERFSFVKSSATKKQMHSYKARLERVVDGDTIRVILDLGFGVFHREILRLAKINAPERKTKGGIMATEKLQELLKNVKTLVIKTNKTDIYGRYIADIFLENTDGKYLNQMLLNEGVAEVF